MTINGLARSKRARLAYVAAILAIALMTRGALTSPVFAQQPTLTFGTPSPEVVAPDVLNGTPRHKSPHVGTNVALQLRNTAGQQVTRVSSDKGTLALGSDQACPASAKTVVAIATTTPTKLASVGLTFCASEADGVGVATLTAESVTIPDATASTTITLVGPPAQVTGTASGNTIRVTVTDAAGANVADGTPVWFTIPPNATFAASACKLTSKGATAFGLNATQALQTVTSGTVLVSAGWNESGDPASCAATADRQVAGTVLMAVRTPVPVAPVTGTITGGAIPKTGGIGIIVYGGLVTSLPSVVGCPITTSAFWAAMSGRFVPYVPGTKIAAVNAEFIAAFPNGIPPDTAIVGKCK